VQNKKKPYCGSRSNGRVGQTALSPTKHMLAGVIDRAIVAIPPNSWKDSALRQSCPAPG